MNETLSYIRNSLKGIYSEEEILSLSRLLMEHCCGVPPHKLWFDKDTQLSDSQRQEIKGIVERLKQNEPIQYILGTAYFYDLTFTVNPSVLIPRPETEELVERIISRHKHQSPNILDIGTGSGCIAVTLARHLADASVYAADISKEALDTARINAQRNNTNVQLIQADILSPEALETIPGTFDVIVSNPPYVKQSEKQTMEANVLEFEPHLALFVEDDNPLLFYIAIAEFGKKKLNKGGSLYFEINAQYGNEVARMLESRGYSSVMIIKDIPGKDRMIQAEL